VGANVDTVRRAVERFGWRGNLGQPSQEDVRATVYTLRQSHAQHLAALVASSDDAILSLDLDGTITTWNRGAQDFFGYAADEVIGKSILSLLPTERQAEEPNILARVGRGERGCTLARMVLECPGSVHSLLAHAADYQLAPRAVLGGFDDTFGNHHGYLGLQNPDTAWTRS